MNKNVKKELEQRFEHIETVYHPDVRWWLAEGLNTDPTLKKNIQDIHDLGFGAAEFLAMPEPGADSTIYGWGSDEWTSDTQLIIREATRLGLGFSLTSGAHWATANLPDTYTWQGEKYNPDSKASAKELDYATIILAPGEKYDDDLPHSKKIELRQSSRMMDAHGTDLAYSRYVFQGVVAARLLKKREGSGQEFGFAEGTGTGIIDPETLTDLTDAVVEKDSCFHLSWEAPDDSEWAMFVFWMHGTCQVAAPSVSTNYTINYMDPYGVQALISYWEEIVLPGEMRDILKQNGRGEIYMDSLEMNTYGAGGILWGYTLKDEFKKRRGYDITKYLPLIVSDRARVESNKLRVFDYTIPDGEGSEFLEKLHTDYYATISDLYVENTLKPLDEWLHTLGMKLRAEVSYGANFEISTPAKYVDGIETETFAQTADIDLYRGMLGAANYYGRPFSSETGAVGGHNYYFDMDTWTQVCYLQFVMGVVRTVFHGYSGIEGSEQDTYWPGHEGMYPFFSERFGARQPAGRHYPEWTKMLGRCQKMLRQGRPSRDLAILRTDYQFVNYGKPFEHNNFTKNFMMYDRMYFWKDLNLQDAGYTYDYFSPMLLLDDDRLNYSSKALLPEGPAYKALIVYQQQIELACANKLLEIAKSGLPILFVDNTVETVNHGEGGDIHHGIAASQSHSLSESDEDVLNVISQIKALDNVLEINGTANAIEALKSLKVLPSVTYDKPNRRVLTCSRMDDENKVFYTFAYCYKFMVEKGMPASEFELKIAGKGNPYRIDEWSGKITEIGAYVYKDGYTCIRLSLIPGEAALIALDLNEQDDIRHVISNEKSVIIIGDDLLLKADKSGDYALELSTGETAKRTVELPDPVVIGTWNITVEDWNEGEKVVNTEEKFGHITKEVYFTTRKTPVNFLNNTLKAWNELDISEKQLSTLSEGTKSMADVSGIGFYKSSFTLPDVWNGLGAILEIGNAGGGTVKVFINGNDAGCVNTRTLKLDISDLIRIGENTIEIEVTTTLTNRMKQRGYNEKGWRMRGPLVPKGMENFPETQAYGLQGSVKISPYMLIKI